MSLGTQKPSAVQRTTKESNFRDSSIVVRKDILDVEVDGLDEILFFEVREADEERIRKGFREDETLAEGEI